MTVFRHIIAALALLAWLFAGTHVALEHGGNSSLAEFGGIFHDDHHHEEVPSPDRDGHYHELSAMRSAQSAQIELRAPEWMPLPIWFLAELAVLLRASGAPQENSVLSDFMPDLRMSGWLFVVHTARPVRGPSLAA